MHCKVWARLASMPGVVPVFLVRRRERARPSRTTRPATRATVSKASAEAASIYSGFLRSSEDLPSVIEVDTHQSRYEYTLAEVRACSQPSGFVAFDPAAVLPLPESGSAAHRAECGAVRSGRVQHRGAQAAKSAPVCPSVGGDT